MESPLLQGVVEGTLILTPSAYPSGYESGYVPVEQVRAGDTVLAACGGNALRPALVEKVMMNDYAGPVRHIHTERPAVRVTPDLVVFGLPISDAPSEVWDSLQLERCAQDGSHEWRYKDWPACIDFTMFAESAGKTGFLVSVRTALQELHKLLIGSDTKQEFLVSMQGRDTAACEAFSSYEEARTFATQTAMQVNVRLKARLGRDLVSVPAIRAQALGEWHMLPIVLWVPDPPTSWHNHKVPVVIVRPDAGCVSNITEEEYTGKVYDLSVAHLRNYVANGIVVHGAAGLFATPPPN